MVGGVVLPELMVELVTTMMTLALFGVVLGGSPEAALLTCTWTELLQLGIDLGEAGAWIRASQLADLWLAQLPCLHLHALDLRNALPCHFPALAKRSLALCCQIERLAVATSLIQRSSAQRARTGCLIQRLTSVIQLAPSLINMA